MKSLSKSLHFHSRKCIKNVVREIVAICHDLCVKLCLRILVTCCKVNSDAAYQQSSDIMILVKQFFVSIVNVLREMWLYSVTTFSWKFVLLHAISLSGIMHSFMCICCLPSGVKPHDAEVGDYILVLIESLGSYQYDLEVGGGSNIDDMYNDT